VSAVIHFVGGLVWYEGRWKIVRYAGAPVCRSGPSFGVTSRVETEVTCKRCLAVIAKAAANQEAADPEPELARDFFEGRGRR
jgi:hypothetical protein